MDKYKLEHIRHEAQQAAQVIRQGGVILYPTDTIWGIGCDAKNVDAVKRIFAIKKRTEAKSLIILVCHNESISYFVESPSPIAFDLIEQWNKPLTIVFPRAKNLPDIMVKDDRTIAIRVTKERFSNKLIRTLGSPLVSTSANVSGFPTPNNFRDIDPVIISQVDYVVDYGRESTASAKASTIIKIDDIGNFEVIRP